VGRGENQYGVAVVKGSAAVAAKAKLQFLPGSLWKISKVPIDSKNDTSYMSSPLQNLVLLSSPTQVTPLPAGSIGEEVVPAQAVPGSKLRDIMEIQGKQSIDMIGVLHSVSGPFPTKKGDRERWDINVIDDSKDATGKHLMVLVRLLHICLVVKKTACSFSSPFRCPRSPFSSSFLASRRCRVLFRFSPLPPSNQHTPQQCCHVSEAHFC
jgi:hypothetical protein